MQVNSISSGYSVKFGALSPELQENMWQAVKRNCPKNCPDKNINKSKLYQDYKKILNYTAGDDYLFVEAFHIKDRNKRFIVKRKRNKDFYDFDVICDVTKACEAKDKYKEMIKIFAKWIG